MSTHINTYTHTVTLLQQPVVLRAHILLLAIKSIFTAFAFWVTLVISHHQPDRFVRVPLFLPKASSVMDFDDLSGLEQRYDHAHSLHLPYSYAYLPTFLLDSMTRVT